MRKKYAYFVNNIMIQRKEFLNELEKCCQRVIHTDVIAGWCGVDTIGFDEKMFKAELKNINGGIRVSLPNGYGSKTYKLFYRKEI